LVLWEIYRTEAVLRQRFAQVGGLLGNAESQTESNLLTITILAGNIARDHQIIRNFVLRS